MQPIVEPVVFTEDTFDVHFHCSRAHDVEESIQLYKREMELIGLKKILLLSMTFHSPARYDYDTNVKNACIKLQMDKKVYVSASVKHLIFFRISSGMRSNAFGLMSQTAVSFELESCSIN